MSEPFTKTCPNCGQEATADYVDNGVGNHMKLNNLLALEDSITHIAENTDTRITDIIDALTPTAWDEEAAGELREVMFDAIANDLPT